MGWEGKMEKARRLHRPSLKDWQCDGLARTFPAYQQQLEATGHAPVTMFFSCGPNAPYQQHQQQQQQQQDVPVHLDARSLSVPDFEQNYESTLTPCVIHHVPTVEQWPAVRRWTLAALSDAHNNPLASRFFKCGEDDDGRSIKVKLRHFLQYLYHNQDDSPLYIFDTAFDEDKVAQQILHDYKVPSYFRNDLFRYVKESRRPPYRWFLVGPERSGTTVHIDPLGTSAWNTLLVGKKRWVLFPPHVPKSVVKGKGMIGRDEDDEAIHYFTVILPRIRAKAAAAQKQSNHNGNDVDPAYRNFACFEFTQHAGETVFVPTGWWHAVLNVTHTVGCTQNFCSPQNFDAVWVQTRSGRKRMAWKWLCALQKHEPALYQRALALNARDAFVMKYDPNANHSSNDNDEHRKRKSSV